MYDRSTDSGRVRGACWGMLRNNHRDGNSNQLLTKEPNSSGFGSGGFWGGWTDRHEKRDQAGRAIGESWVENTQYGHLLYTSGLPLYQATNTNATGKHQWSLIFESAEAAEKINFISQQTSSATPTHCCALVGVGALIKVIHENILHFN